MTTIKLTEYAIKDRSICSGIIFIDYCYRIIYYLVYKDMFDRWNISGFNLIINGIYFTAYLGLFFLYYYSTNEKHILGTLLSLFG